MVFVITWDSVAKLEAVLFALCCASALALAISNNLTLSSLVIIGDEVRLQKLNEIDDNMHNYTHITRICVFLNTPK